MIHDAEVVQIIEEARGHHKAHRYPEAVKAYQRIHQQQDGGCVPCLDPALALAVADDAVEAAEQTLSLLLTADMPTSQRATAVTAVAAVYENLKQPQAKDLARIEALYLAALAKPEEAPAEAYIGLVAFYERLQRQDITTPIVQLFLRHHPKHESAATFRQKLVVLSERAVVEGTIRNLAGDQLDLTAYRGKVVVLDFWTTWRGPCKASLPTIRSMARRSEKQPLVVIGINGDQTQQAFAKYVEKEDITWPQYWDQQTRTSKPAFGIKGYPTFVVLDHEGKPIYRASGWNDQIERTLRAKTASAIRRAKKAKQPKG